MTQDNRPADTGPWSRPEGFGNDVHGPGNGAVPGPWAGRPERKGWSHAATAGVTAAGVIGLTVGIGLAALAFVSARDTGGSPAAIAPPISTSVSTPVAVGAGSAPSGSSEQQILPGETPSAAPAGGCDAQTIARDIGRPIRQVAVHRCRGDWVYLSSAPPEGELAGDSGYLAHRDGGRWREYASIPSSKCLTDALAEGVPPEWAHGAFLGTCGGAKTSAGQGPQTAGTGDLGLSTPMTVPPCDDRGIVVLKSAVTPGSYAAEVATALAAHPGAKYLRTDRSCPSLRQRDENGMVIYAVFRYSGYTQAQVCADVASYGGYGRWLSASRSPTDLVTC